jgi:hypothetical protein
LVGNPPVLWLIPVAHASWLPSGIEAPFERFNAWRALIIMASLWLLVCSVWLGFLRRQSFRILFSLLVLNGFLLALFGFAEQLTQARRIYWRFPSSNDSFVASFVYRNYAGAYFNLIAALAVGMALRHFLRVRRRLETPVWTVAYAFAASTIAVMVIFSYSRMAFVLLLAFCIVVAAAQLLQALRDEQGTRAGRLAALIVFLVPVVAGLLSFRSDALRNRFAQLASDPSAALSDRATVRRASEEMFADRWLLGWGAGSFRYAFPTYQRRYPSIFLLGKTGFQRYWEHAHCDLLEFPIEYGAAGMIPILFALGCAGAELSRNRFWRHPAPLCAVAGCILLLVHAWVDFVLQCPAILLTWGVFLAGSARMAALESAAEKRLSPQTERIRAQGTSSPA